MKRKILILNRRDLKNPLSGGAEIYTHEIFRRLCDEYDITHFSSAFEGCRKVESIDGIKYIRKGGEFTMHFYAFLYTLLNYRFFDLIIDEFNGLGMMTFFFKRSIILIHQLYDEFWVAFFGIFGYPFKIIEKILLRFYRNKPAITVSNSTKEDLIDFGFRADNITIIFNGIDFVKMDVKKGSKPVLMYLGRMRKTKNPEDAIRAYLQAKEKIDNLIIHMVGDGEELDYLKQQYQEEEGILFHGFVSEEEKYKLLRKASVLLVPSIREGWGQIVIQANMMGTPVIGYDVAGIRDSVRHENTGFLVDKHNPSEMSNRICDLLTNPVILKKMSDSALEYSSTFSWEKSADGMRKTLNEIFLQIGS